MTRPRLSEDSKTVRVQIVITEAELVAIDKWQHANRIGSRSEAIRQLIEQGIDPIPEPDFWRNHGSWAACYG